MARFISFTNFFLIFALLTPFVLSLRLESSAPRYVTGRHMIDRISLFEYLMTFILFVFFPIDLLFVMIILTATYVASFIFLLLAIAVATAVVEAFG